MKARAADVLRAWLLLPAVAIGLRVAGLHAVRRRLASRAVRSANRPVQAQDLSRAVSVAARTCVAGRSCLSRALVLESMLRSRGVPAQLEIGVRRRDSGIDAHAWVSVKGIPVPGQPGLAADFARFDGLQARLR